jgi:hypothetical protein
MPHSVRRRLLWTCTLLATLPATRASAQPPPAVRDSATRPAAVIGGAPGPAALPALTADAQRLVDQWKQDQASIVEQLHMLQQAYRDAGHAEDAAAVAAQIRMIERRTPGGSSTYELVHEGLANRDLAVSMMMFRDRGETLSFAIRGRDDQAVWGTTTYTDDSGLETAAVHAGLLRAGQNGIVKVKPLPGQERYDGSNQNGIQSSAYAAQKGSFRFVSVSVVTPPRSSSMTSYRDLVGQSITLPVVGAVSGNIWGTDVYTDDSSLGVAAVHAGLVQPGEFAFVKVTLLPGQAKYDGSPRTGVMSQSFGQYPGSYRLEPATEASPVVQLPGGEDASRLVSFGSLRGRPGTSVIVQVMGAGSASGSVWGTDVYTDDSSLAAAAVHAGLLKPGETGLIRVTVERGRDSYAGSPRNGVSSLNYGAHQGSYRLERVK